MTSSGGPADTAAREAAEEAVLDVLLNHPMWEGLDYSPKREAVLGDFCENAVDAVVRALDVPSRPTPATTPEQDEAIGARAIEMYEEAVYDEVAPLHFGMLPISEKERWVKAERAEMLPTPSRPTPADGLADAWDEGHDAGLVFSSRPHNRPFIPNPYHVATTDDETPHEGES